MKSIAISILLTILSLSTIIKAADASVTATVNRILFHTPPTFGACMIQIEADLISNSGINCPDRWLSLSCSGDFNTKDIAYKMLDFANQSLLLGNDMRIYFTDTKKHNGYCVVYRLDLVQAP